MPPPPPAPPPPPPPVPGPGALAGAAPPAAFKTVPLLGDALHEMKKKLTGFEETPAAAEGVSVTAGCARGPAKAKSHYGAKVPGKPKPSNAFLSEIQTKLSTRRDKVDREAYVVETPDHLVVVESLPPAGPKGDRRLSRDSGRYSLTPSVDGVEVDYSHYPRVSVDRERKEELALAKEVRRSSVKMRRCSGGSSGTVWDSGDSTPRAEESPETVPGPGQLQPPSPVVMRYWKQCAGAEDEDIEHAGDDIDQGQSSEPAWKVDALEGDASEFPSIRDKIANMEEVGKTIGQFTVPDNKARVKTTAAPAAGWMEARSKLQGQLDSLIARTTAKISKYGTVHAVEPREREVASQEEEPEPAPQEDHKKVVSPSISNLIKSVANEIQKSFSSKNLAISESGDCDEDYCDENNNDEYWRNLNEKKLRQPKIDMEAPIDFDYNEPEPEVPIQAAAVSEECQVEETDMQVKESDVPTEGTMSETLRAVLEEDRLKKGEGEEEDKDEFASEVPVDFDSKPRVLDFSAARSKATLMRKTSSERRLPAAVLAKRRAADKQSSLMQHIERELIDASLQVNISNTEEELESMSDEEKVDLIAKQISKMESGYIMKLLKQLETGVLDISVPMLLPFLSLQVRLDLGTNIFKGLGPDNKVKVVKETFIQDMINDITDIALLQEVIERTQEKINFLTTPKVVNMDNYYSLEDDCFDLPSPGPRCFTPTPVPVLTEVLCHLDKLMKEGNNKAKSEKLEAAASEPRKNAKEETIDTPLTKSKSDKSPQNKATKANEQSEESAESDEGLPSSESVSSLEEERESGTQPEEVEEKEIESENRESMEPTPVSSPVKVKSPEPEMIETKTDKPKNMKEEQKETDTPTSLKENKESEIKQKLRNILDNCKTNDQQRPVRNFARNFEFQGVQLKPVVPNDRRPAKARRMDDMWNKTLASKQKWPCNTEPAVPKPKVPWTMNKNTQPQKKEEDKVDKEVKEFDKCHNNLKTTEAKQNETVKNQAYKQSELKDTENPKKNADVSKGESLTENKMSETSLKEEKCKPEEPKEISKETPKEELNEMRHSKIDEVVPSELKEDLSPSESEVKVQTKETSAEKKTEETNPVKESKYRQPKIDEEDPIDFDSAPSKPKLVEKQPVKETTPPAAAPPPAVASAEVPSTPIVRRRGDTFTVVLPSARPPPPPPCSRPPPPPLSPPVPAARIVEMEREEQVVVGRVQAEEVEEISEGEESEWEWTEESEEEEEGATYEVTKEGWENIMSDAKGPTTFNADYSIKVVGK